MNLPEPGSVFEYFLALTAVRSQTSTTTHLALTKIAGWLVFFATRALFAVFQELKTKPVRGPFATHCKYGDLGAFRSHRLLISLMVRLFSAPMKAKQTPKANSKSVAKPPTGAKPPGRTIQSDHKAKVNKTGSMKGSGF